MRREIPALVSAVEEAELRRLVYRAFKLRGKPGFAEALRAIEDWQVETAPERMRRSGREPRRESWGVRRTRASLDVLDVSSHVMPLDEVSAKLFEALIAR